MYKVRCNIVDKKTGIKISGLTVNEILNNFCFKMSYDDVAGVINENQTILSWLKSKGCDKCLIGENYLDMNNVMIDRLKDGNAMLICRGCALEFVHDPIDKITIVNVINDMLEKIDDDCKIEIQII